MSVYDVIVIGAGPAGMLSAVAAARRGAKVLIFDKNREIGRKLSITGKGRCNITNNCSADEFLNSVVVNRKFLYSAAYNFAPSDTINFFESLGLKTKTERGKRVFPESDKAIDVVNCLKNYVFKELKCSFASKKITKLIINNNKVAGVKADLEEYIAKNIIIACGGMSYPKTGSTGWGYKLAKQAGHRITPLKPSLVALVSSDKLCYNLQGLTLKNIKLSLLENNKAIYSEQGDMLFTHFGVSGPLVLSASANIKKPEDCHIVLDLKPALDVNQLDARVQRDFSEFKNKAFKNSLNKLLPKKLIPEIIKLSEIPPDIHCNSIKKSQREMLVNLLKNLKINISGFRPIEEAIITRGGVETKEINPKTMQSKLISGLFFAGEVLDVDAYTGGYNLQIAFCTGYTAGSNISL